MPYMNGYWFGFGGLLMLLFWIFVIAGIVWLVLALSRQQHVRGGEQRPSDPRGAPGAW